MSIDDVRSGSCGREEPAEQLAVENPPPSPASIQQSLALAHQKPAVFQVSASLPRLQTFEELSLPAAFQKAVEEELSRDEKLVWLGRPSRNGTVPPPKTAMRVVGGVLLGLAVLLPLLFKGMSFIFPVALVLFGLFFLLVPMLFTGANVYPACYFVTNRRAILFEKGLLGLDPANIRSLKDITGIRCKSYHPHELLGMERRNNERVPGTGDLIFEYIFAIGRACTAFPGTTGTVQRTDTPQRIPRGFFYLDQAAEVENLIRTTLLASLENSLNQGARAPAPAIGPVRAERPSPTTATCACGAAIQASGDLAGQSVQCPQCGSTLRAPSRTAAQTAAGAEAYQEDGRVPADLKEKMLAELGTNEHLVWIAQPVSALVFRRSLGYLIGGGVGAALGLLLLLGGLVSKSAATAPVAKKGVAAPKATPQTTAPITNPLGMILLAGSVGCMAVSLYRWKMAQRSCYALTNRRALVFRQGLFGPNRESYSPLEVARMRRSDSLLFATGGDLIFRTVTIIKTSYGGGGGFRQRVSQKHYGFLAIARVQEVEKLVRETLIDPFVDKRQMANSW
jgi:hypothetical protein